MATGSAVMERVEAATTMLRLVDPATLIVGDNVRQQVRLDKGLVRSIRERGVLEPIVAYEDGLDGLVVLHGQRRTLAAVEAACRSVPVMVVAKPAEPDRLVDQIVENEHRAGISMMDRVAAYEQLAAFGVSAAQIAKRTATPRPDVDHALAVARSELARGAAARWEFLSLEQAAVVAEFDGDGEAVKQLVVAAQRGGFDHVAQRLRDARVEAAERAAAAELLAGAGVRVIERPDWRDKAVRHLRDLKQDDEPLSEDTHGACPGHAAYLDEEWLDPRDDGDEEPDESDADEQGDAEMCRRWVPVFVCTDFAAHGHLLRWGGGPTNDAGPEAEKTEAEWEAARLQRRDVIRSNKDWDSATRVRVEWLRGYLTRKRAPETAAGFVAGSLARADHEMTQALTYGNRLARDVFGLADQTPELGRPSRTLAELVAKATPARSQVIGLGVCLAAYEAGTHRSSWRSVSDSTTRYLRFLETQGYELSPVERRACGESPSPALEADTIVASDDESALQPD